MRSDATAAVAEQVLTILEGHAIGTQAATKRVFQVMDANPKPPTPILATLAAERAEDPEVAKVWKEAAEALSRARTGRSGR